MNMPKMIATNMVLHNLLIINNKKSKEDWIIKAKTKLTRRNYQGRITRRQWTAGESTRLAKMARKDYDMDDVPIIDRINDMEPDLCL